MLEFKNQMLLDLLHEDGLLVAACGLGIEEVLINLICSYADKGNLVLVIGTSQKEEEFFLSLLEERDLSTHPKCVTSECSVPSRTQLYLDGGVLFVTSRILVVDLLMKRVPVNLITGVIVWKAHRILESCQDAFILRLYRQQNKTGFIKAFSSSPISFTAGFCHVERVMKNLFVKKLYLWPRFHVDVTQCLAKCKPEVIELHIQMTSEMQQVQMAVLDLISSTLQELKLSNRMIDIDEFCTENAISKSFEKMIKIQLEPVWHQLSVRTKQLVADLKVLRTILMYLNQYDSVTFYNLVNSLRTTEKAMQSAGWMLLGAADSLFLHSKNRVFGSMNVASPSKRLRLDNPQDKVTAPIDPKPEVNPKWLALSEVLAEIRKSCEESQSCQKCMIVTQDDRTAQQLKEFLVDGATVVLKRLFYRTLGQKLGLTAPPDLFSVNARSSFNEPKKLVKGKGIKGKKVAKKIVNEESKKEDTITLTQITKKYDFIGDNSSSPEKAKSNADESNNSDNSSRAQNNLHDKLLIMIHPLKNQNDPYIMNRVLTDIQPKYIIMYDSDLKFIRQIEVWHAESLKEECLIYFLIYKGTAEEQIYLTNIKREKGAFEHLIKEKAAMVIPEYADGRTDDHPDLNRVIADDSKTANDFTRKGGKLTEDAPEITPRIIVDMREFRSELPSIIHKRGIDIEPATIEVGDYILTPDICVERKSISDLIGSLNSGRLYNQAQAMTRHYKKPILLIEFDHNKPFHLQGRLFLSSDGSSSSKDVSAKLQLLTLHFPNLRLLWCPSPYATAEVFHMLKSGKPEPSVDGAQAVTSDVNSDFSSEKFNPLLLDFVSKLPGVTSKNLNSLLRNVKDLPHLLGLSIKEITDIIGNAKNATELHAALHECMKPVPKEILEPRKGSTRLKFGKKPLKRVR